MNDASRTDMEPRNAATGGNLTGSGLFWRAQIIGWFLFGIVYFLALLPRSPAPASQLFGFKMVWAATGIVITTALSGVYRATGLLKHRLGVIAAGSVGLSAVTAAVWVFLLGWIADRISGNPTLIYTPASFPFVAMNHFLILLAWSGAWLTLALWQKSQAEERKSLAAMNLAREAELAMLRYQLNPHFLFNALTSVKALITENPGQARETLSRLSDFLRYTLSNRNGATVSVAEEMQIVRDYLAIEKVRFEERLDARVELEPQVADERLPVFIVHTLVENSVKHGTPVNGRLGLHVSARSVDSSLRIEVANTGRLETTMGGNGIGLANVRARLQASHPGRHGFELRADGDWVRAVVTLDLADQSRG